MGTFDLESNHVKEHFVGDIKLPQDWSIGLIVGNSGTGKTTIAKELFPDSYITNFEYHAETVLDDMPKNCSVEEITKAFNAVGFSSPRSWLKPYHVLSGGEKMRCDLARAMLTDNDMFVFDEFTSVVDRNVAKIGSFAIQKAIRKNGKKRMIAVGCHFDVEDWLLPDWVFDTNTMSFRTCEAQKKNRPECEFRIFEVKGIEEKKYYWSLFGKYHYLSHTHNYAARVFIGTLNGDVCSFVSVLPFPHPKVKNKCREHRIVVLPDYQGIGIGVIMTDWIAEHYKKNGKTMINVTSAPALIHARRKSKKWILTSLGRKNKPKNKNVSKISYASASSNRITVSFQYVGDRKEK